MSNNANDPDFLFIGPVVVGADGTDIISTHFSRSTDRELLAKVVDYLEAGHSLYRSLSPVGVDLLAQESPETLSASIVVGLSTDGHWIWTYETAHYARAHGLLPPVEFVEEIRANGFKPPELDEETVRAASAFMDLPVG